MSEIGKIFKGITVYEEVDNKLLSVLNKVFGSMGQENPLQIGDVVAMNEYGCRKSSIAEVSAIPEERIISRSNNGIVTKNDY